MAFQSGFQSGAFQTAGTVTVVVVTPPSGGGGLGVHSRVRHRTREDVRRAREELGIIPKARKIVARLAQESAVKQESPSVSELQARLERENIAWNAIYASLLEMQAAAQRQALVESLQAGALITAIKRQQMLQQEQEEQAIILLMYQFM